MKRICKHFSGGGNFAAHTQLLKGLLSLLLTTSAFTSCTNESEVFKQSSPKLDVKFGVALQQARAIFTDASLPSGSVVGAMLDDGTATDYDSYSPLYFTATGAGDSQTWTPNTDVVLTETKGTLYAYYPHDGNVDISAIPIDMTAADQTDWLYATPVTDVNENNASVAVTLNHTLANINVSLVKGSYVGTGNVTSISVQSDGIAPKGTFNAAQATPDYTAFEDEGTALERTVTTTLGGTATDIMVIPTGSSATITFNVTVDGTVYTATSAAVELEKGSSYKYTLTLNSTFMGVSDVAVTPWNVVTKESLTLEKFNPWDVLENGVYAVTATGEPIDYNDAAVDATCLGVALITDNQRIMIEKNETANAEWNSNTTLYWGKNLYQKNVAGITETTQQAVAKADFSGKEHTNAIIAAYTEHSVAMDARDMCSVLQTFNDGENNGGFTDWYIPAAGQLYEIYTNKTNINAALTAMSSTAFSDDYYWSSSEGSSDSGWFVDFGGGIVISGDYKNNGSRVRFVRDI